VSTRISYDAKNKPFGQMLAEVVDEAIELRAKVARLKDAMDDMASGTPPTWDQIELELGIEAGKGEQVYNLLVGLNSRLSHSDVRALTRIDQG
jgi:hypothetical protein